MPLLCRQHIAPDALLGIWQMDEDEALLLSRFPFLRQHMEQLNARCRNATRRREWLSVRALLATLLNDDTIRIDYTDEGQPILSNGMHISISHTRGYAAVMVSAHCRVGIDIERKGRDIGHLRKHFMRDDEQADHDDTLLLHWCAKEALYKLWSDDHLTTQQMRIHRPESADRLMATNLKRGVGTPLYCIDHPDFLLVHLLHSAPNL